MTFQVPVSSYKLRWSWSLCGCSGPWRKLKVRVGIFGGDCGELTSDCDASVEPGHGVATVGEQQS